MAPMDFPLAPAFADRFEPIGGPDYSWDGYAWKIGPILVPPPPLITRLTPDEVIVGSASPVTVRVLGRNFVFASTVQLDGVVTPSTFVSATELTFSYTIPSAAITIQVSVTNHPTGQTSATRPLIVAAIAHTLTSIAPSTVVAGTPSAATITATGTRFTATSTVTIDNVPTTTTYVSATSLTFAYPVPTTGTTVQIKVITDGKITNALPLETLMAPVLLSLAPNTLNHQQTGGQQIGVTGENFVVAGPNATVIYEDGVPKTTQVSSATGCAWSCMWPGSARTLAITARNGSTASAMSLPLTWTGS